MTLVAFDEDQMYYDEVVLTTFKNGDVKVSIPIEGRDKVEEIITKDGFKIYLFCAGRRFTTGPFKRWLRSLNLEEMMGDEFFQLAINIWTDRVMRCIESGDTVINFLLLPELGVCYRLRITDSVQGKGSISAFKINEMGIYALEGYDTMTSNMTLMMETLGKGNPFTPKECFAINSLIYLPDLGTKYSTLEYKSGEVKTGLCIKELIKNTIPGLMKSSPMLKELLTDRYKQLDELKLKEPKIEKI